MLRLRLFALGAAGAVAFTTPLSGQTLDSVTLAAYRWRQVGPANFEGRVADVVGIPSPSKTFFVAAAAGGIWKTVNSGTTFRPVFDTQRCVSMGALAIAPSDTMQVWAGTGEQNSRNTIEPGCGIFKSSDGGMTWKLMGLEKTQHIGRIAVHPTNPNIVYVAALGAAWKSNPERGLYKTEDGGTTWKLVKFVSDKAGFIDVAIDPRNPNTVWASSYERSRGPYFLKSGGAGSALWKSTDAGATWTEIKGGGYPDTPKGRIGLAVFPGNPDIVYALTEADSIRGRSQAGAKRQRLANGLYRTKDGGKTWEKTNDADTRPFYYSQVRVDPRNSDKVWFSSTDVLVSDDGGKTTRRATQGIHVDHHAMWIDPNDPDHFIVGDDGGISWTWDAGGNYEFAANLPIGQFYDVSYDNEFPYNICGGAQDNGSWCGPSRRKQGPVTNSYWFTIAGGDGFYTAQHPNEPWIVWGESQGGNVSRLNLRTGDRTTIVKPSWRPRYQQIEDSIVVATSDTTQSPSRETQRRIADMRAQQRMDSVDLDLRWNWETPFFLSAHNPDVFYIGSNRVLKSTQRGDNLFPISPDLSKKQYAKIDTSMRKTGGITLDATGAETYGTIVSLAESYVRPGYLYAGTDDGNVWVTRNDGATWEAIPTSRFVGLPSGDVYVTKIEPSHFDSLTFYIAFDNHRWNDFTPYLYVTRDFGRSFTPIANDLQKGGVDNIRVVREDPHKRDLLYVGTATGVYVSLNAGTNWQRFMTNLPTVPVYDLKIHPRERELIAATHGRSFWLVDVSTLEQMTPQVASADVHLFQPKTAYEYGQGPAVGASANGGGHKVFQAASPQYGAEIAFKLKEATRDTVRLVISDAMGDTVRTLPAFGRAGINRVVWDFRGRSNRTALSPSQRRDSIALFRRAGVVLDSLEKAGTFDKASADRMRQMIAGGFARRLAALGGGGFGGGGGGGGGFGANAGQFNPRPGESAVVGRNGREPGGRGFGEGAAGGEEGGGAGAAAGAATPEQPLTSVIAQAFTGGCAELRDLMRVPGAIEQGLVTPTTMLGCAGGGGGGGGFGRLISPLVNTGDYLVTLQVGGRTFRQVLRVERVSGGDDSGFAFEEDDDRDP